MQDPNRPPSDPEAAQQISQSQLPPDAEAQPADALPPTDGSSAPADAANDPAADSSLALDDVSLPDSPSLAENASQPDVFEQDLPDAFDGLPPAAPDDTLDSLDLQPSLSDSMDNLTDAATDATTDATTETHTPSVPADSTSGEMPSFSDCSPPVDPFAASPPPFTGPLVEVSPGVFVYPGFSMPWSTDAPAQPSEPAGSHAGLPWLHLTLGSSQAERFMDKALDRTAMRLNRIVDQKLESHTNEVEFIRAAQMRALNGR